MGKSRIRHTRKVRRRTKMVQSSDGKHKVGHKGKRHLASSKSRKRKRQLGGAMLLGPRDEAKALSVLPYG